MAGIGGAILLKLNADSSKLKKGLKKGSTAIKKFGVDILKHIKKAEHSIKGFSISPAWAAAGTAAIGVAVGVGKAALSIAQESESAQSSIKKATGATGQDFDRLYNSFKDTLGSVPDDMQTVADVFGTSATLLADSTEDELARASEGILDFARVTDSEATKVADSLGRAAGAWGMNADDLRGTLDTLTVVTQDYGISSDELSTKLQKFGPIFQNMGLSMDTTALVMGRLYASGQDVSRIAPGINAFGREVAALGQDPLLALQDVEAKIRAAPSQVAALNIATDAFGAEGAQRMLVAIQANDDALGLFGESIEDHSGILDDVTTDTATMSETWQELWNEVKTELEPVLTSILNKIKETFQGISLAWGVLTGDTERETEGISAKLRAWATVLHYIFEVMWAAIKTVWDASIGKIIDKLVGLFNSVKQVVQSVIEVFQGLIDFVKAVFSGEWGDAWTAVKQIFGSIWDAVKTVLGSVLETMFGWIRDMLFNVLGIFDIGWTAVKNIFAKIWNGILEVGITIGNGMIDFIEDTVNAIIRTVKKVAGWFPVVGDWLSGNINEITIPRIPVEFGMIDVESGSKAIADAAQAELDKAKLAKQREALSSRRINAGSSGMSDIESMAAVLAPGRSYMTCLLYTSPSPRDRQKSRMPSSA